MGARFLDIRLKISDLDCDPLERSEAAMILTCPKCATRFFAEDDAIGSSGRRVECGACGQVWSSSGATAAPQTAPNTPDLPVSMEPDQDTSAASESSTSSAAPLFVERPSPARKVERSRSTRPLAIALLALAFVLAAGAFVFQRQIEQVFPGASTVYESMGVQSSGRSGG